MGKKEVQTGKASIQFAEGPQIIGSASVVGEERGGRPLSRNGLT